MDCGFGIRLVIEVIRKEIDVVNIVRDSFNGVGCRNVSKT